MENAEEIMNYLEEFSKRKPKTIPQELNEYLAYVARTGDPVYQWALVKSLFKEKLLNVITDFYETTPGLDIPPYPNVDPFNYDVMKNSLLERLDSFTAAPFTVQRICELLTFPRKQYNRIDKFMRAVEKNILVVSTREPGNQRNAELENGEPLERIVNGSDNNSEYNVDVEMEDMSWKENAQQQQSSEPQPGSSDAHISVDDISVRLQAKQDTAMAETQDKTATITEAAQYESVTPPDPSISEETTPEIKQCDDPLIEQTKPSSEVQTEKTDVTIPTEAAVEPKMETESITESVVPPILSTPLVIPEITVDDAEMTEQKLSRQASLESDGDTKQDEPIDTNDTIATETMITESKEPEMSVSEQPQQQPQMIDESSSDSNKEEIYTKLISEVSTSSEESSSSSDVTDGNSNSPKADSEPNIASNEESNPSDSNSEEMTKVDDIEKIDDEIPKLDEEMTKIDEEVTKDELTAKADDEVMTKLDDEIMTKEADEVTTVVEEVTKVDEEIEQIKEAPIDSKPVIQEDKPASPKSTIIIQPDDYSISDVNSELPQPATQIESPAVKFNIAETVVEPPKDDMEADTKVEENTPEIIPSISSDEKE